MSQPISYYLFREDGDLDARGIAPDDAAIIKPARKKLDGLEVAIVRGADWATDLGFVMQSNTGRPLVVPGRVMDLAKLLTDCGCEVFVSADFIDES